MKITLGQLRSLFREGLREAKVAASPSYMKKELARETIQQVIRSLIEKNDIHEQAQLDEFFQTIDMSIKALKMIPVETWRSMRPE